MAYATVNPFTGEQVKTFPNASDQEIQQALDAAQEAFNGWKTTTFTHRSQILQKAADLLRAEKPDLAGLLTLEMGKLFNEAQDEVEICAEIFEYYARHAETLLQPEKLPASDEQGEYWLKHEPLGVLLAVEPWNFPYYQVARIIAPQLAAGNTILPKCAECPALLVRGWIARAAKRPSMWAGLLLNVLPNQRDRSTANTSGKVARAP